MQPTCETCRFYSNTYPSDENHEGYGRCHRYPPILDLHTLILVAALDRSDNGGRVSENMGMCDDPDTWEFPSVNDSDWCGEHHPIPAE